MTSAMISHAEDAHRAYDRRPSFSSPSHSASPDDWVDKYTTLRRPSIISIDDSRSSSPRLPSFTLQGPSPHKNTLPPLDHIKSVPWSSRAPLPPLGHRRATAPVTLPRPHPSIRISSPTLLTPPLPSISSPPHFDLARYAMSPDQKPKIFDDSASSPRSISGGFPRPRLDGRRDSVASVVLGDDYLRRRSSIAALTDSPERSNGKKRKGSDRDDSDGYEPASPLSFSSYGQSSQEIATPRLEVPEPSLKRRASSPRIVTEKILPQKASSSSPPASAYSSLYGWDRHDPAAAFQEYKFSEAASKTSGVPVGPQDPVIAFPIQFPWQPSAQNSGANGTNPVAAPGGDRVNVDPATSSVRSGQQGALAAGAAPEIRFPDETLASATAPGADVDASQVAAAALAAEGSSLDVPEDDDKPSKDQPFSRSPELRVSHKLAERKRRKEMKDLFDELRELLPAERGSKSSKWEILSKSIDYIAWLKTTNGEMSREVERLRRDLDIARGGTGAFPPYHGYTMPQTYPGAAPTAYAAAAPGAPAQPSPTNAQANQPRAA